MNFFKNSSIRVICCLLFFLGISMASFGQNFDYQKDFDSYLGRSQDPASPFFYEKLLERFNAGDTALQSKEILHLLIGFTAKSEFRPYSYFRKERDAYSLVEGKEYQQGLVLADSLLSHIPVSQQAIISKAAALHYLGRTEESSLQIWKFDKIMRAMAWSGDGATPETAFFALGPADGQNFIEFFLGQSIGTMGSGSDRHGNFVDILEMVYVDEGGEQRAVSVYFQIEHASKTILEFLNGDTD